MLEPSAEMARRIGTIHQVERFDQQVMGAFHHLLRGCAGGGAFVRASRHFIGVQELAAPH